MKYLGEREHITLRYPSSLKDTLEKRAAALDMALNEVICHDIERANKLFERQNGGGNGSRETNR